MGKKQIKLYYAGDANAYSAFMGNFSTFTGVATMSLIMICKGIVRKFGWLTGALITPTIVAVDVIGGRLGKAGGGFTSSTLLTVLGVSEAIVIAPYLACIVAVVIVCWLWAAINLSKRYEVALKELESKENN